MAIMCAIKQITTVCNISHVTRGLSGEFYDQLLTVYDVSNVPFLQICIYFWNVNILQRC